MVSFRLIADHFYCPLCWYVYSKNTASFEIFPNTLNSLWSVTKRTKFGWEKSALHLCRLEVKGFPPCDWENDATLAKHLFETKCHVLQNKYLFYFTLPVCPAGTFGLGCQKKCSCYNGLCDHVNGKCHCHPGYRGVRCERGKKEGILTNEVNIVYKFNYEMSITLLLDVLNVNWKMKLTLLFDRMSARFLWSRLSVWMHLQK